jgi:MFS family permease
LGYAVAVYSVGAFIANPLFGGLADKFTTKSVLVLTIILCFLGNAGYALCEPIKSKWLLLFARFVVGTFAGSNSVVNAHISQATTKDERTFWMTMNTIGKEI